LSDARLDALLRRARLLGPRKADANRRRAKIRPPALLFFTDPGRTPEAAEVIARLPPGSAVVYRAFGAAEALETGRRLLARARRRRVLFLVGADAALAAALNADGLHLPERLAARAGDNARLRRRFMLTAAAHGAPAVSRARRAGVQAVVLSPVFPSRSPSAGRPLGALRFRVICRGAGLPVYALGGITERTARRLQASGAAGLAGIEVFLP
jgi:thiamine-phosphate pyrophosphorylase